MAVKVTIIAIVSNNLDIGVIKKSYSELSSPALRFLGCLDATLESVDFVSVEDNTLVVISGVIYTICDPQERLASMVTIMARSPVHRQSQFYDNKEEQNLKQVEDCVEETLSQVSSRYPTATDWQALWVSCLWLWLSLSRSRGLYCIGCNRGVPGKQSETH
ncbi:hypothetical protein H0E87_003843 [Populus deltoides]|uniref:Uncharacterized protein n=1 Tax=Populus deltoides TaxID=3696 RepID=A0A8T2ZD00_POPDE|nr:hypothetical protein H0E87_003843 [Populus deltoides]